MKKEYQKAEVKVYEMQLESMLLTSQVDFDEENKMSDNGSGDYNPG